MRVTKAVEERICIVCNRSFLRYKKRAKRTGIRGTPAQQHNATVCSSKKCYNQGLRIKSRELRRRKNENKLKS